MRPALALAVTSVGLGLTLSAAPPARATVIVDGEWTGVARIPLDPAKFEVEELSGGQILDDQDGEFANSFVDFQVADLPPSAGARGFSFVAEAEAFVASQFDPLGSSRTATAGANVFVDYRFTNLTDALVQVPISFAIDFQMSATQFDCPGCPVELFAAFQEIITDTEILLESLGEKSGFVSEERVISLAPLEAQRIPITLNFGAFARETNLPVSEPMTAALVLSGIGGIWWQRRRRKGRAAARVAS